MNSYTSTVLFCSSAVRYSLCKASLKRVGPFGHGVFRMVQEEVSLKIDQNAKGARKWAATDSMDLVLSVGQDT